MALKTCDFDLEANQELQPHECQQLYHNMKSVVWIVKVVLQNDETRFSTGFCVHEHGYIVTSAFRLNEFKQIFVRDSMSSDINSFIGARWICSEVSDAGLALLEVGTSSKKKKKQKKEVTSYEFAGIGDDSCLTIGTSVFGISHPGTFYFTLLTGTLVSALKGKNEVGIRRKGFEGLARYIGRLSHSVQLFQIGGFRSIFESVKEMHSLGAPVFNSRGHIIGMIVAVDRGFDFAIPASNLKRFLEEVKKSMPSSSKGIEWTYL